VTTLYFHHDDFLHHDTGAGHPESPARLRSIDSALTHSTFSQLQKKTADLKPDCEQLIRLVHNPSLMDKIFAMIPQQGYAYIDQDTVVSADSGRAALRAVSTVCIAVDQIVNQKANNAFCAVRPPGHHAEPDRTMGFCLFNNIAIAAVYAQKTYGLDKIAIIDFDVHHGNGTQAAFYNQPNVFYASSHQMPHYPGTGNPNETGLGNILNVPLAAGDNGTQFKAKYHDLILPALIAFKPELILLSAGFDAHKDDPLASIRLEADDFGWLTEQIMAIANQCCNNRIISVLEGGYNLPALAESVAAHVKALTKH
jgi:acetoin utilization deacetylase AcuC-like enzyme